jgi:hypothetical protein
MFGLKLDIACPQVTSWNLVYDMPATLPGKLTPDNFMQDPTKPEYLFTMTTQGTRTSEDGYEIPWNSFLRGDSAFEYCNYVEVNYDSFTNIE